MTDWNILTGEDMVFHYTSMKTAVQHILGEGKLKLNPCSHAHDPFEFTIPSFSGAYTPSLDIKGIDLFHLSHCLKDFAAMVCFCGNPGGDCTYYDLLKQGFAKMRMWNQYGENHNGVCIAFSKKRLIEILEKSGFEYWVGNIEYSDKNPLTSFNNPRHPAGMKNGIGGDNLPRLYPAARDYAQMWHKNLYFTKSADYRDESEWRIVAWSDEPGLKEKAVPLYLDIRDAIVAIVLGCRCEKIPHEMNQLLSERPELKVFSTEWHDAAFKIDSPAQLPTSLNPDKELLELLKKAINSIPEQFYSSKNPSVRNGQRTRYSQKVVHPERRFQMELYYQVKTLVSKSSSPMVIDAMAIDAEQYKQIYYNESRNEKYWETLPNLFPERKNPLGLIPDLVIHNGQQRNSSKDQHLILECKTSPGLNYEDFERDIFKLNAYLETMNFRQAVGLFVNISPDKIHRHLAEYVKNCFMSSKGTLIIFVKPSFDSALIQVHPPQP